MQWGNLKILWTDPLVFKVLLAAIAFVAGYFFGAMGALREINRSEKEKHERNSNP